MPACPVSILLPVASFTAGRITLATLEKQTCAPGTFEVIWVDLAPGADSPLPPLPFPLRRIRPPRTDRAFAWNAAVEAASGDLLIFLAEGALAEPDLVSQHQDLHGDMAPHPVMVLGDVLPTRESLQTPLGTWMAATLKVLLDPDIPHPGHLFRTLHGSAPRRLVAEIGAMDPALPDPGQDPDLGLRLESMGARLVFLPAARVSYDRYPTLDALEDQLTSRARSRVSLFRKHPASVACFPGWNQRDAEGERRWLGRNKVALDLARGAAADLAALDLGRLDAIGGPFADLARDLEARTTALMEQLSEAWERRGLLEGLAVEQVERLDAFFKKQALVLAGLQGRAVLVTPEKDTSDWWDTVDAWLQSRTPYSRDVLLAWSHPSWGVAPPELQARLAALVSRAGRRGEGPQVFVLDFPVAPGQEAIVVASARAWLPTSGSGPAALATLVGNLGLDMEPLPTEGDGRWRIDNPRPFRILAWPDWSREEDLRSLLEAAAPLLDLPFVSLVLRFDPALDGDGAQALGALSRLFQEIHGDAELDIFLEDRPMDPGTWVRLGAAVDAVLVSSPAAPRTRPLLNLGAPALDGAAAVSSWLQGLDILVQRVRIVGR